VPCSAAGDRICTVRRELDVCSRLKVGWRLNAVAPAARRRLGWPARCLHQLMRRSVRLRSWLRRGRAKLAGGLVVMRAERHS
jgi:hypothetical protein